MKRRALALVVAALAVVGCAGPQESFDVSMKGFPSDVVLGSKHAEPEVGESPRPAFVPPNALPPPPVVLAQLPPVRPGRVVPTVEQPAPACPEADVFSAPKVIAPNEVTGPPVEGVSTFRNTGVIEVSGPDARKGPVPPATTRTVRKVVVAPDTSFTHEVVSTLGETVTTTSYHTVTTAAGGGTGGIFITSIATRTGDGPVSTFTPNPALEVLRFPIEVGTRWTATSVDTATGTVVGYAGTIGVKRRIDACGTLLDGQVVRIDGNLAPCVTVGAQPAAGLPETRECPELGSGFARSARSSSSFVATYVFGTQYGGVTLFEESLVDSTEAGVGVHRKLISTIDAQPPLAVVRR
jgi:hypothetical protein